MQLVVSGKTNHNVATATTCLPIYLSLCPYAVHQLMQLKQGNGKVWPSFSLAFWVGYITHKRVG